MSWGLVVQTHQPEGEINIKQKMGFHYVAQASLALDSPALAFLAPKSQVHAATFSGFCF